MTGISGAARHALLPAMLALAMAGCGAAPEPEADEPRTAASAPVQSPTQAAAEIDPDAGEPEDAAEPAMEPDAGATFDINTLPQSTAALGALPYFTLPDRYRESGGRHSVQLDFGQVALWVGDRFHTAEGQVYATGIRVDRDSGKQYSGLEVARNLEHAVTSAGGVEVFAGDAQAVVDALAAGGVDPSRLEARGHGQSQPVADESTEQGRARNRRVELIKL